MAIFKSRTGNVPSCCEGRALNVSPHLGSADLPLFRCCGRFCLGVARFSWWLITWSLWRRQIGSSSLRTERWWRRGLTLNSWPREAATIIPIKTATFYKVEPPSDTDAKWTPGASLENLWTERSFCVVSSYEVCFRTGFLINLPD